MSSLPFCLPQAGSSTCMSAHTCKQQHACMQAGMIAASASKILPVLHGKRHAAAQPMPEVASCKFPFCALCSKILLVVAVPAAHLIILHVLWPNVRGPDALTADSSSHFYLRLCHVGALCGFPVPAPGEPAQQHMQSSRALGVVLGFTHAPPLLRVCAWSALP